MRDRRAGGATDREVGVVAAVLVAGSEKAAAHRLGLSHSTVKHHLANARSKVGAETTAQLVWILAPRLPEPEGEGAAARAAMNQGRASGRGPPLWPAALWGQPHTISGFRDGGRSKNMRPRFARGVAALLVFLIAGCATDSGASALSGNASQSQASSAATLAAAPSPAASIPSPTSPGPRFPSGLARVGSFISGASPAASAPRRRTRYAS